jgi:diaminohydroxyphosphoribosylaminopyrimidine deaminase/5-amino-6-(5-phosphoribosylamino)uracil reductase
MNDPTVSMQTDGDYPPQHKFWMNYCLELARQGLGNTAPNPLVGCAIVRDGQLLGCGFHPQAGQPHAEVFAIWDAQSRSNYDLTGATLYVNLEPCNHHGRTPPCTEAILATGISAVVVGTLDCDPRVSGQGVQRLRNAGLQVTTGVLEAECLCLNEAFFHRVTTGLPFGILKYAMTLDGKIATHTGHSFWITNPASRRRVHQLRGICNAVITGGHTVRRDNSKLTTHGLYSRCPLRVVVSSRGDFALDSHLCQTNDIEKTLIITEITTEPELLTLRHKLRDQKVEILEWDTVNLTAVMQELARRGCNTVLWECGGNLAGAALRAGLVQKVYSFIAPKIIGGGGTGYPPAPSPVADLGKTAMTEAITLERTTWENIEGDLLLVGYVP